MCLKNMNRSNLLKDIPKNSKLCIYGTGETGISIKKIIELTRNDLEVVYFIDSFKSGTLENLEIIPVTDISGIEARYDFIVVASNVWSEIEDILINLNIHNYIIINYHAFTKYAKLYLLKDSENFTCYVGGMHKEEYILNCKKAGKLFKDGDDKKLFDLAVDARFSIQGYNNLHLQVLKDLNKLDYQYLEFVNREAVKTLIDGGMFNGDSTVKFLSCFKNISKIYGFEPLYNKFSKQPLASIINKSSKVKIENYGLWNSKTQFLFRDSMWDLLLSMMRKHL